MPKQVQLGTVTYMNDVGLTYDAAVERYGRYLLTGLHLLARAHRAQMPTTPKYIVRLPDPVSDDPLDGIGSVGLKGWANKLPWYTGWLDAIKARLLFKLWERKGALVA